MTIKGKVTKIKQSKDFTKRHVGKTHRATTRTLLAPVYPPTVTRGSKRHHKVSPIKGSRRGSRRS